MPIYTYSCNNCGHQFEQRQRMSDEPLKVCPVCKGRVRRVVNSVGIVFKGSGFYVTDNRNGSSSNGLGSSSSNSSSPVKKDKEEKSDTTDGDKGSKESKKTADTTV